MSWWGRLLGANSRSATGPRRVDYLGEALALEKQGDFDAALTSYRLALRDHPHDPKILMNIAIAYTRTGRVEDAIRSYRRTLELAPDQPGAHYGLSFLLLKRNDRAGAIRHLEAFLGSPNQTAEMEQWVAHAKGTLERLRGDAGATDQGQAQDRVQGQDQDSDGEERA